MDWEKIKNFIIPVFAFIAMLIAMFILYNYNKTLQEITREREIEKEIEKSFSLIGYQSKDILNQLWSKDVYIDAKGKSFKKLNEVEQKKERLINLPSISLHYRDEERIKNFYNDYFREPTTESFVKEVVSEASGEAGVNIADLLKTKAGSKNLSKWIRTVKLPETSISGMFHRYQRETIIKNQVTLNLDIVDIELSKVVNFQKDTNAIKNKYNIEIDPAKLRKKEQELKSLSAEKVLKRLESASGATVIDGKFRITDNDDQYYKIILTHSVNKYLPKADVPITISALVPKAKIATFVAGNYAQSINKTIPLKIYGQVWRPINRAERVYELQITPLAIYQ